VRGGVGFLYSFSTLLKWRVTLLHSSEGGGGEVAVDGSFIPSSHPSFLFPILCLIFKTYLTFNPCSIVSIHTLNFDHYIEKCLLSFQIFMFILVAILIWYFCHPPSVWFAWNISA
jgi:hypothetical protein